MAEIDDGWVAAHRAVVVVVSAVAAEVDDRLRGVGTAPLNSNL